MTELFRYDTSSGVVTVGYTSYAYDSSQRQIGITHRDGSSSVIVAHRIVDAFFAK